MDKSEKGAIAIFILIFSFVVMIEDSNCNILALNIVIENVQNEIDYNEKYGEPMTDEVIISRIYFHLDEIISTSPKLETVNYYFLKIKENMN